ncbi:hypothetical protein HS1genome_2179 [Sulfodiicoccus acidiphilus]|uniref:Uncharacterized protein n=1 Tax=Sulfodiicoccus acidiphilus TaxID=1670455 RepID=A0A348B6I8_9CREN|nr:hypothetical protein HS1genome_2179 [Sulfodiicoccus acidiphilus]GGU03703.1 hypothetical protein GCM10007116_20710 [Sulfodiicoccus acidiphilus]
MEPFCEQRGREVTEGFLSTGVSSPSPEGATQLFQLGLGNTGFFITKRFYEGGCPPSRKGTSVPLTPVKLK